MLNLCQISSLVAATDGTVAEFSSFANLKKEKGNQTFWCHFWKYSPKGFFWPNKKSVISLLSADSGYFRTHTLKCILTISSYHTSRRTVNHLSTVYSINIILTQLFLWAFFCRVNYTSQSLETVFMYWQVKTRRSEVTF